MVPRAANKNAAAHVSAAEVADVFAGYPDAVAERLMELRELILTTAAEIGGVGQLTETLKWGEPAYLTEASKSGSTIRIGWKASDPDSYAIYLNCQTTLVDTYRTRFPELIYRGNRAICLSVTKPLPRHSIRECIALALTYHRNKKPKAGE